jgi:glutathione S-transferase
MKLVNADRCPYCARVRIALAYKQMEHEVVEVDLRDRPQWLLDLNPPKGRVPVIQNGFDLPESEVIMGYLDEIQPERPLLPATPAERARARLLVYRFDDLLGDDYYAFRRDEPNDLVGKLEQLEVGQSAFVDFAFAPWVIRARETLGVDLPERLDAWLADLVANVPSVSAEIDVVRAL